MRERTNEQWRAELRGSMHGSGRDEALSDLRAVLVRGLRAGLGGRREGVSDAAIEDFAQEALIKILQNLDSFRGESRFTTWAQKIAVRVAFTELRRKEWRNVSLQDITGRYDTGTAEPRELTDSRSGPEDTASRRVMLDTVQRLIQEELTERQRDALVAVMLGGHAHGRGCPPDGYQSQRIVQTAVRCAQEAKETVDLRGFAAAGCVGGVR